MSETRMPWIAEDPASKGVLELARKVAETSTTLLITGESGTGKDQLARLIHELGPRVARRSYLPVRRNRLRQRLPQELVESGIVWRARARRTFTRRGGGAQARASGDGGRGDHRAG